MQKSLISKFLVFLLVAGLLFALTPTKQAQAADISVACTGSGDTSLLQTAINGAGDGDKILVSDTCVLDSGITVSKAVTLDGGGSAKIQVSGTGYRITMTTAGATLQGFDIEKTDKTGVQDIIYIAANNVTVHNNKIHGQYAIGDGDVSRAMVTSGGYSGVTISNNEIYDLRQPGYFSGVITGNITNNYTYRTKGWVLEQGDMTFTGNTWGTGTNANVYDIAILAGVSSSYYTNVPAMSAANNNAFIEDQRTSPALLTPVYVNASAPACSSDCGTARAPYNKIQDGIDRVIPGGTVNVLAGTYNEKLLIPKALTMQGSNWEGKIVGLGAGSGGIDIKASNVTLQGLDISNPSGNGINLSNDQATPYLDLSNISILNNKIHDIGGNYGGFTKAIKAAHGPDNVTIEGNEFYNITNTVTGSPNKRGADVISFGDTSSSNPSTGIVIRNNTFRNITAIQNQANAISFNNKTGVSAIIEGNTFDVDTIKSPTWARVIGLEGPTPNTVIQGNTFNVGNPANVSNSTVGINFETNSGAASVAIEKNSFLGGGYPLINAGSYSVDASPNWFGQATGPAANQPMVGAQLVYIPWCTNPGCTTFGQPPVHNVTQNTYYYTIQAAITAATAGDSITVAAGTYNEDLVITKGLTLTGAGIGQTIVQGVSGGAGDVVVSASNVTIQNFTLKAFGQKFIIINQSTDSFKLIGNEIITGVNTGLANGWVGIETYYGTQQTNHVITGNAFVANGTAQLVYYNPSSQANMDFTNNTITGTLVPGGVGVVFESLSGAYNISGNDFADSLVGAYGFMGTPGLTPVQMNALFAANNWPAGAAVVGTDIRIPDTKLLLDPATISTTGTCTGPFEVTVKVQAVTNMTSYQLYLTYDPDLINVTNVVNVSPIAGAPAPDNSHINGQIKFGWYPPVGGGSPATYTGDYSLIKITFMPKNLAGTGVFTILPTSWLLDWPEVQEIPYEITGGATYSFGSIATNVSKTPPVSYCSLAAAVADAASGDTVRVDVDHTINARVDFDKTLTLDLNGKVVNSSVGGLYVKAGGALTINDFGGTGKIVAAGNYGASVTNGGSLILNGGTIESTHGSLGSGVSIFNTGSSLTVNGGKIIGSHYGISGNGSTDYWGTAITINGGTIQGRETAIFHPQHGTLKITGGDVIGGSYNGIELKAGSLEITGGTISTSASFVGTPAKTGGGNTQSGDAILVYNRNGYGTGQTMDVTISGGTITSANGYALREFTHSGETSRLNKAIITGGHFTGGTPGAVFFSTNTDANLDLLPGSDYSSDPIVYVYAPYFTYQVGARWYIGVPPTITSPDIQGYYLTGEQREFHVSVSNPSNGGNFAHVIFQFNITANAGDLSVEYWTGSAWANLPLTCASGICSGYYGPSTGFPMANPYNATSLFRVTGSNPGNYPVEIKLLDLDTSPNAVLASFASVAYVYDKPVITIAADPYFIVNEPGQFKVTISNPATGRNYGNNIVFDVVVPNHVLADFGTMSCSYGPATWPITLVQDGANVKARIFGLDPEGRFNVGAPFGPMTVTCTATLKTAGAYAPSWSMVDMTLPAERVVQTGTGSMVAYTKPTIVPTFPVGPIFAGVPVSIPVEITNPSQLADPFDLVLTVPDGTVVTAAGYTVTCAGTTCTLTVDLTDPAVYPVTLPLMFTFPAAGTPDIVFTLVDREWLGAGTADRTLATFTKTALPVTGGFTVSGTITMQSRPGVLAGIPVTLYWDSTFATYGPSMTTDTMALNFHLEVLYGGTYKFTTLQPRYLNITADMLKTFNLTGNKTLASLWLRGGNAVWRAVDVNGDWTGAYDNVINGADASLVGDTYGSNGTPNGAGNSGDVNFDGIVNIKDLTLVGGNMGLTSVTAYGSWMP